MHELTFEVPLAAFDFDLFPRALRDRASSVRFLRFGTEGFLVVFRVPADRQHGLVARLRRHYRASPLVGLHVSAEGKTLVRVQGSWFSPTHPQGGKVLQTFRRLHDLELRRDLAIRPPSFSGDSIRFTVVGELRALRRIHRTLVGVRIEHRIHRVQPFEQEAESPMETLTAPQRRALLRAHALGYFEVPRRADTGRVARELGLNRGTVGRHIRRAEQHLVEWAISHPAR